MLEVKEATLAERLEPLRHATKQVLERALRDGDDALTLRCVTQLHKLIVTEARLAGEPRRK